VKPVVALIKAGELDTGLSDLWKHLGEPFHSLGREARVLIKPNCTCARDPETGAGSDLRIAHELARLALEAGASEVVLAEGIGSADNNLDQVRGIDALRRMEGVRVVDLNEEETREVTIDQALVVERFRVPIVVLEADFVVNLAKLKVHPLAGLSLAFKNMMGALPGRARLWPEEAKRQGYPTPYVPGGGKKVFHDLARDRGRDVMREAFVDLNRAVPSHLTVIDGLYGMEGPGSPAKGRPVRMNLLIASHDIVAAEAVGAAVMGFDPQGLGYLRAAVAKGLGAEHRLDGIEVRGEGVEEVSRRFEPADAAKMWNRENAGP
jgi:uncharacterized protein (DUF362 family)